VVAAVTERIRSTDRDDVPEFDPGVRRRLDGDAMLERDAAVARLLRRGLTYRAVAAQLNMSLGSVQKSVKRTGGYPL
jgi:DNA-binding NarL/FixJ family response regulator